MTVYEEGDHYQRTKVSLELEIVTKDGFIPSLKDLAEMTKPYGELTAVRQITTNDWGSTF